MKRIIAVLTMSVVSLSAGVAFAQTTGTTQQVAPGQPIAGRAPLGVTVIEMEAIVVGWSAKKDLLGKTVVNDKNERIGKVEDLIVSPGKDSKLPYASFAIIGVGGFLGIGRNDVAIPMEQLRIQDKRIVLPGATKDALKALPKFEYRK
jgi:sporulation protein YlmC with PRC-barrel domain